MPRCSRAWPASPPPPARAVLRRAASVLRRPGRARPSGAAGRAVGAVETGRRGDRRRGGDRRLRRQPLRARFSRRGRVEATATHRPRHAPGAALDPARPGPARRPARRLRSRPPRGGRALDREAGRVAAGLYPARRPHAGSVRSASTATGPRCRPGRRGGSPGRARHVRGGPSPAPLAAQPAGGSPRSATTAGCRRGRACYAERREGHFIVLALPAIGVDAAGLP